MDARHDLIGIKQTLRLEWLQRTTSLLLAGLEPKAIRHELHDWLADRMGGGGGTSNDKEGEKGEVDNRRIDGHQGDGGNLTVQTPSPQPSPARGEGVHDQDQEGQSRGMGKRGATSRAQVVNMLMKIWVAGDSDLAAYREASLAYLRANPAAALAIHWGMVGAVYPFWFNTARQVGRLLALQDQVTQAQIIGRLKEHYGDRQTVGRYGRYAIRSQVAWGVIRDSAAKGCYEKVTPVVVDDPALGMLLVEAALHATPEAKATLSVVLNSPAFFPFQLPPLTGDLISRGSNRIEVLRHGLDEELLKLTVQAKR